MVHHFITHHYISRTIQWRTIIYLQSRRGGTAMVLHEAHSEITALRRQIKAAERSKEEVYQLHESSPQYPRVFYSEGF